MEEPSIAQIAITAGFGAAAGGLVTIPKQMPRREVYFNLLGGVLLAASIPQVVEHYFGVHPVARCLLGVLCGLSVPFLVGAIQKWTVKKVDDVAGGQS
jgi:hypothetical protein